ncbi:MAG: AAA family ATPase [Candidatus Hodarchaeota archaeon]
MDSIEKPLSNEFSRNELLTLAKSNLDEATLESLGQLYSTVQHSIDRPCGPFYYLDWIILDGLKTFRNKITVDLTKNPVNILLGPNGSGKTSLVLAIHYSLCGIPALRRQKRSGGSFFTNRSLGDRWISIKSQFARSWGSVKSVQITRMMRKRKSARVDSLIPSASDNPEEDVQANIWDPHNVIRTPENVDRFIGKSLGLEPSELYELSQLHFFHEKPNYLLSRNYRKARRNLILWLSGLRAFSRLHNETRTQLGKIRNKLERVQQKKNFLKNGTNSNLRIILENLDNSTREDVVQALQQQLENLTNEEQNLLSHLNGLEQIKSFLTSEMEKRAQRFIDEINRHYEILQLRIFNSKQALLKIGELGKLDIAKRSKFDDFSKAEQKLLEILFRVAIMAMFRPEKGFLVLETPSEDLDQEYKQLLAQELTQIAQDGHRLVCTETNPKFVQALTRQCQAAVLDLSEHATLPTSKLEQTSLDYFFEEV